MIGPSIKFHLDALKVKPSELANRLGKDRSYITALTKPKSNPKWGTIINVAEALNIKVSVLVFTAQFLKDTEND
jgi:transcriptional regulator with XRE-family HTH domain